MARKKPRGDEAQESPGAPAHPVPGVPPTAAPSDADAVFSLPDTLTIHGVRDVKANLQQRLAQADLIVDLQRVREVDTAGVQLLLAFRRARLAGGTGLRWQGEPGVVAVAARALGLAQELELAGEA